MSFSSDINDAYEEEIGLTVEDNGRTWIENAAQDLPHRAATARVYTKCFVCRRRELSGYVRGVYTEETRFRFKTSDVSVRRWRGLTGGRKFVDHRFCVECGVGRAWLADGIEPIEREEPQ